MEFDNLIKEIEDSDREYLEERKTLRKSTKLNKSSKRTSQIMGCVLLGIAAIGIAFILINANSSITRGYYKESSVKQADGSYYYWVNETEEKAIAIDDRHVAVSTGAILESKDKLISGNEYTVIWCDNGTTDNIRDDYVVSIK